MFTNLAFNNLKLDDDVGAFLIGGPIGYSIHQQSEARNDERRAKEARARAAAAEKKKADIASARQRVNLVRESRLKAARSAAAASAIGASGSSLEAGVGVSIESQISENISFLDKQTGLSDISFREQQTANIFENKAASHLSRAQTSQTITDLGAKAILGSS